MQLQNLRASGIMRRFGTSYFYAHLFLPPQMRYAIAEIYKLVRIADQIVDNTQKNYEHSLTVLLEMRQDVLTALSRQDIQHPQRGCVVMICQQYAIDITYFDAFFAAMMQDCQKYRYKTYEELEGYMYGSAQVIGLILCDLMQAPANSEPYAQILGEAMQYTNFLRDVKEDYMDYGRIYLPEDRLLAGDISYGDIQAFCEGANITHPWRTFMQQEILRTRELYRQADVGISLLPANVQKGIMIASKLYQGILDKIESIDYDVFAHSAKTTKRQKLKIISTNIFRGHTTTRGFDGS